jgi:hypothetical protein
VLAGTVQPGDKVAVDAIEGELHFDIDTGGASEPEEIAVPSGAHA